MCGRSTSAACADPPAPPARRNLANIFKTLPTREEFPTYYAIIPEPIDLDGIKVCVRRAACQRSYESLTTLIWPTDPPGEQGLQDALGVL